MINATAERPNYVDIFTIKERNVNYICGKYIKYSYETYRHGYTKRV